MSTSDTTNALLTPNENLAEWLSTGKASTGEGGFTTMRSSSFGELMVQNLHGLRTPMLAKEGSQWVCTNAQGTAILDGNASAFSATAPTLSIVNNNAVGGKTIYVTRVHVTVVAVGTSSTNWVSRWIVDTGNRFTSGGTALTPTNPNLSVTAAATGAVINFGALLATAASANVRTINNRQLRVVVPSAGDEVTFEFGNTAPTSAGMIDVAGQFSKVVQVVGVALAPQQSLLWYQFGASQGTARSFDNIDIEYIER